jgi:RNA polymerase subunit RPABC4/transcription elongation factor Spt4
MAATKCNNCGAKIPAEAQFCPGCGIPKAGGQPVSNPVQARPIAPTASMMQRGSSPMEGLFYMVFSKTALIIAVGIGILLAWIGLLIAIFSTGNSDIAMFLNSTGFAGMGLMLICGGIWNHKINRYVRAGLVIIGGIVIIMALGITAIQMGSLSSFYNQLSNLPGYG